MSPQNEASNISGRIETSTDDDKGREDIVVGLQMPFHLKPDLKAHVNRATDPEQTW
jgi:hypothetical protein